MNTNEIQDRVVSALQNRESKSASQIARQLGLKKSEVNSTLYRGKGSLFCSKGETPPFWSLLEKNQNDGNSQHKLLIRRVEGTIHIDFPGGDWELEVQMADMSRNDPVALVERMGERKRLITVSHQVVSHQGRFSLDEKSIPDAAVAIAASVLAWEIFQSFEAQDRESFDYEMAVSNIFLSISAHALSLESS